MLSSKSKSGLSEASMNKGAPATPRSGKLTRTGSAKSERPASPSPLHSARLSIDRSLKSFASKPSVEHRSTKISSSAEKELRKGSELQQAQLNAVQDELRKVRDRLGSIEKEKSQILEDLKSAKNSSGEANDKLQDALVSRRIAEEASEIDRFRADELEQAGIEAARQREEEWRKEVETVRNQHAVDVAALLAATQELQRVQHELAMATEAKNSALSHADDAMNIAEINADKVELLLSEVSRLKGSLDSTLASKSREASELAQKQLELQSRLTLLQETLKKAKEQLVSAEIEKIHIVEELTETKRLADEATEELGENLAARARAEEALETIKIRARELEQERIKNSQKREEEWQKKLESVEHQQAVKVAALLTTTEELEKAKHELEVAIDEKNTALNQVFVAMNNAEAISQKLELLSREASHHQAVLDTKAELEGEVSALRSELEEAKAAEKRLAEVETLVEELRVEIGDAKKAESDVSRAMDEWRRKAEILEVQLQESTASQKSSSENAASVIKQLEESTAMLQDRKCEVSALGHKVEVLELELGRHKTELDKSNQQLDLAREEATEKQKTIRCLKCELEAMEEAKFLAVENENAAASKIKVLTEEKNELENELDVVRCELEKMRKEMEGLTSQLHGVSTEARQAKEMVLTKQSEVEDSQAEIEELKMIFKKNQRSYEAALGKARLEIVCHQDTVERLHEELEKSRSEWDAKALDFMGCIQRSEDEVTRIKADMESVTDAVREAELRVKAAKEDELRMLNQLKHLESEASAAYAVAEKAKAQSLQLKEMLLDKENELQSISQENADIRSQEYATMEKVNELSSLLAKATVSKSPEENGQVSRDLIEHSVDPLEHNTDDDNGAEEQKPQFAAENFDECVTDKVTSEDEYIKKGAQKDEQPETRDETSDNDRTRDKDQVTESPFNESDSKIDGGSLVLASELAPDSPGKLQQQQRKKKLLMQKFGNLLKKKSNSSK